MLAAVFMFCLAALWFQSYSYTSDVARFMTDAWFYHKVLANVVGSFKLVLVHLLPLHQIHPPPRRWRPGIVDTRTPSRSCWTQPQ